MQLTKSRLSFIVILIAVLAAISFWSSETFASSCERRTPTEHIEGTEVIFLGIPGREAEGPRDNDERVVQFKVLRGYKGIQDPTIAVKYVNDHGGNRGWGFRPERTILVFAQYLGSAEKNSDAAYVSYCSMVLFYGRGKLQSEYWRILGTMRP